MMFAYTENELLIVEYPIFCLLMGVVSSPIASYCNEHHTIFLKSVFRVHLSYYLSNSWKKLLIEIL
ncbi:hypothetical protein JHK85_017630 [Glycine max]|nr:hypothetical protein JHK85_017630 [Glycine max]